MGRTASWYLIGNVGAIEIDDNMERYEFFSSIPGFLIGVEELVEKTKIEYEEGHVV